MKTTVMTIANRLHYTQGMSRSQALKTAWQMVKISLVRDLDNEADPNAVAIVVEVIGKGSYQLGYLKKEHAQVIAPLLDKGVKVTARLENITGGPVANRFKNFGANISFDLVA